MGDLTIKNLSSKDVYDYENAFYWFSDNTRLAKLIAHYELYKKVVNLPGHVAEFGVFKGNSLIQWGLFRYLLENSSSRKIYGFDAFGNFPKDNINSENDLKFINNFTADAGTGNSKSDIEEILKRKKFDNVTLIEGDVRETFPKFIKDNPAVRFNLVHLDLDVYEPSIYILEAIEHLIVKGGIIVLDDYAAVEGETIAVDEYLKKRDKLVIKKLPFREIPSYIEF